MKVIIDPHTQCETFKRSNSSMRFYSMLKPYISIAKMCGLLPPIPKLINGKPEWHSIHLSKMERKGLSYEDQLELRRYKWTLKVIRKEG